MQPGSPPATTSTGPTTTGLDRPVDTIRIQAWHDEVIDALGVDPRSAYVEQFWLAVLGPSTTWLLRRVADGLDHHPEGFDLPLADTARSIGVGHMGGRHSPFTRALTRLCQFELARPAGERVLDVRRRVPPLSRRQVVRLPEGLQVAHRAWQEAQLRRHARPAPGRRLPGPPP